jgi:hypothetical protein
VNNSKLFFLKAHRGTSLIDPVFYKRKLEYAQKTCSVWSSPTGSTQRFKSSLQNIFVLPTRTFDGKAVQEIPTCETNKRKAPKILLFIFLVLEHFRTMNCFPKTFTHASDAKLCKDLSLFSN